MLGLNLIHGGFTKGSDIAAIFGSQLDKLSSARVEMSHPMQSLMGAACNYASTYVMHHVVIKLVPWYPTGAPAAMAADTQSVSPNAQFYYVAGGPHLLQRAHLQGVGQQGGRSAPCAEEPLRRCAL